MLIFVNDCIGRFDSVTECKYIQRVAPDLNLINTARDIDRPPSNARIGCERRQRSLELRVPFCLKPESSFLTSFLCALSGYLSMQNAKSGSSKPVDAVKKAVAEAT